MSEDIVKDIYDYLERYEQVDESAAEELANDLKEVIVHKLQNFRQPSLSMSSIGKAPRKTYMDLHHVVKPDGKARLKFLFGDIIEVLTLWLVKQSGHKVTDKQQTVEVDGVSGSIDCKIDDVLCDVKSCSPSSYLKFASGSLPTCDTFGYLPQLSGYREGLNISCSPFFLAVNKVTGEMCTYHPDADFELPDVHEVIKIARESSETYPEKPCAEPESFGEAGNKVLPVCCKYCPHKNLCWPNLRVFKYANGLEYFTHVEQEPRVPEITNKE